MAYIAERDYSKDEILENYINDIYLGQRGQEGIYGVWEASEYYFSKEPRDLTIGEMATIAGLISSPNRLNPLHHPDAARPRRDEVLASMLEDGYIDKTAYDAAVAEPLRAREVYAEGNDAPYFVDFVKKELAERYPPQVLSGEGLRIFTSLDVHMEKLAEAAIDHNLARSRSEASEACAARGKGSPRIVPGRARAAERQDSRDGRRTRLPFEPVQSRYAVQTSAGFGVQAGDLPGGVR